MRRYETMKLRYAINWIHYTPELKLVRCPTLGIVGDREPLLVRYMRACTCPPTSSSSVQKERLVRTLYDCPEIPVGPEGTLCRVVVATHPATKKKSPVGVTRAGIVYELFFTNLPQQVFTAADFVELYLHHGALELVLSDEDQEIDPDRWCGHSAWGQKAWQVVAQWMWNIRLELGHRLHPDPRRTTEFAPALPPPQPYTAPASCYAPAIGGRSLEGRSLLRSRFHASTRWDAPLGSGARASCR